MHALKYIGVHATFAALIFVFVHWLSPGMNSQLIDLPLIDLPAFQVVFAPLVFFGWLSYRRGFPFSKLLMVLGIPLGLIGVMIGLNGTSISFIQSTDAIGSIQRSASANAVIVLCATYGGLMSAVGYFCFDSKKTHSFEKPTLIEVALIALGVSFFWVLPVIAFGGKEFVDFGAALLLMSMSFIALWFGAKRGKNVCVALTDAAIYTAVISVAVGLALWYANGSNPYVPPIRFTCLSILYSLVMYVLVYLFSFYYQDSEEIRFEIKNWHLAETSTFYVFLVFAPISISDYLYNENEAAQQGSTEAELRLEIAELSERLTALEKSL